MLTTWQRTVTVSCSRRVQKICIMTSQYELLIYNLITSLEPQEIMASEPTNDVFPHCRQYTV